MLLIKCKEYVFVLPTEKLMGSCWRVCTERKCLYFEYYTQICFNFLRIFISFLYFRKHCSIELMTWNAFDESYYKNIYIFFVVFIPPFIL